MLTSILNPFPIVGCSISSLFFTPASEDPSIYAEPQVQAEAVQGVQHKAGCREHLGHICPNEFVAPESHRHSGLLGSRTMHNAINPNIKPAFARPIWLDPTSCSWQESKAAVPCRASQKRLGAAVLPPLSLNMQGLVQGFAQSHIHNLVTSRRIAPAGLWPVETTVGLPSKT